MPRTPVGVERLVRKLGMLLWDDLGVPLRIASELSVKSYPMRIAILQRDPVMRQSIEKVLMSASHTCMVYDDGLTMSKALARSTVDMLVLDWQGTRLSGAEVLRSVRAVGGDRLPVLFASAETSEDSVVRAFASGADDYVALPLRPGEFRERVAALLRRAYPDRFSAASFDVGPYHFDMSRCLQSLIQQGPFTICSKFVQNPECRFAEVGACPWALMGPAM
jgi:DNA-binding response OmpR family regulator